jgi:hypothetical protein
MKIIAYSLFGAKNRTPQTSHVFFSYMRGFYFNCLMNSLIFPDWHTHVELDAGTYSEFDNFFNALKERYLITFDINPPDPLCRAMLWRMKRIFKSDTELLLCRDADSLTTYREAQAVQEFVDSGLAVHGITDNPAHGIPLMGGMCGFRAKAIRDTYGTFDKMIAEYKGVISEHGTDQTFLNNIIYPRFKSEMYCNYVSGMKPNGEAQVKTEIANVPVRGISERLWESNLIIRHVGGAGFVEMEAIRFFERLNIDISLGEVGKKYPRILNWIE